MEQFKVRPNLYWSTFEDEIITIGDLVNNQNVSNQEVSKTISHICNCGKDAKNNW